LYNLMEFLLNLYFLICITKSDTLLGLLCYFHNFTTSNYSKWSKLYLLIWKEIQKIKNVTLF